MALVTCLLFSEPLFTVLHCKTCTEINIHTYMYIHTHAAIMHKIYIFLLIIKQHFAHCGEVAHTFTVVMVVPVGPFFVFICQDSVEKKKNYNDPTVIVQ